MKQLVKLIIVFISSLFLFGCYPQTSDLSGVWSDAEDNIFSLTRINDTQYVYASSNQDYNLLQICHDPTLTYRAGGFITCGQHANKIVFKYNPARDVLIYVSSDGKVFTRK